MLEIGSIVDGKYKILNKIGQGGMSVVYLAMNERANKQWAIKEIRKDGSSNYEVVKQGLIAETDMLKKLSHPHLPSIIDVIDNDETFLIVMDYIEGNSLSKILERHGAQPQENVIAWSKQLCDVLGYLHSRQPPIVYRDMKPSNVMLKPDGNVTLIDFGTAREYKTASIADTTCLGTQGYAAPEQYGGLGQTDGRTDIYCLGSTMYHLVTGRNPAEPPYEMYPIRQMNPKLSSGLEQIIIKCTQRNPDDRYQSCAELMYALEHYKELEDEAKREYSQKWSLFIGASIAAIAFSIGAAGFKVAATSQTQSTYDYYITQGDGSSYDGDFEKAMSAYRSAIELSPERQQAYNNLLSNCLLADDEITMDEAQFLDEVVGAMEKGDNLQYLAAKDKEAYAKFALDLGEAYYFSYYDQELGEQKSQKWFLLAKETNVLDEEDANKVDIMLNIVKYKSSEPNANGTLPFEYTDFWNDWCQLAEEQYDNLTYAVRVYKVFLANVMENENRNGLKYAGITNDMIYDELCFVQDKLFAIKADVDAGTRITPKSKQELEQTLANIETSLQSLKGGSGDAAR